MRRQRASCVWLALADGDQTAASIEINDTIGQLKSFSWAQTESTPADVAIGISLNFEGHTLTPRKSPSSSRRSLARLELMN